MRVARIARDRYGKSAKEAFNGEGSRLAGGRWHSTRTRIVYTSESEALALLEYLTHVSLALAPRDLRFFAANIPDDAIADISTLPSGWNAHPPGLVSASIGDAFVDAGIDLALRVPSVVIPFASNVLVNPNHVRFEEITFETIRPYEVDDRFRSLNSP